MKYEVCYVISTAASPEYLVGQVVSIKPVGSKWSKYEKGQYVGDAWIQLAVQKVDLTEEEFGWFCTEEYRLLLRKEEGKWIVEKTGIFPNPRLPLSVDRGLG